MESEGRVAWANLPAELLAMIYAGLQEEPSDMVAFRKVCRPWRSFVSGLPNKISPFFPRTLTRSYHPPDNPQYLTANAVYLLRSNNNNASWIVSVKESKPGELLLRHALTCKPIPGSSLSDLDMSSLTLTPLSISYTFHATCRCRICTHFARIKPVLFRNPPLCNSMALFVYDSRLSRFRFHALRRCLSNNLLSWLMTGSYTPVVDFVNFNGHIFAVDSLGLVYVLDDALVRLTCVNFPRARWEPRLGKRFVVSDGDLYLVVNFCTRLRIVDEPPQECDFYKVYKLVMDDVNAPTRYDLERVKHLGDRVFFLNKECTFSVSARDLSPSLAGNCIVVGPSAFRDCSCFSELYVYHLGDKPGRMGSEQPHHYSALFFTHADQLHKEREKDEEQENESESPNNVAS